MSLEICDNFSFIRNTTYGCGGYAKYAVFPENVIEAQYIFDQIRCKKYFILGNGSNVLAQDGLYNGYILVTKKMRQIEIVPEGLYCESGVTVSKLLNFCKTKGLSGLEFLSGIPATVGGICYMNAGIAGKYIADRIISVIVYDGKKRIFSKKDCNFTYKNCTMRDINCLILGCLLKVEVSSPQKVQDFCSFYLEKRRNLPKGKSCGCVFKNLSGKSAGAVIEAAGLKGYKIGNAYISDAHANFIINNGTVSQDVYDIIHFVKRTIYKKFSTELKEEVCYIGDFK